MLDHVNVTTETKPGRVLLAECRSLDSLRDKKINIDDTADHKTACATLGRNVCFPDCGPGDKQSPVVFICITSLVGWGYRAPSCVRLSCYDTEALAFLLVVMQRPTLNYSFR